MLCLVVHAIAFTFGPMVVVRRLGGGCAQRWLSVEKYERNWRAQRVAHIHTHLYATANGALRAHTYEQLINLSKPTHEQSEFEL